MISVHGRVERGELTLELDLEIEPGASYVVGANGAGKTTLLRVLAGLEALDSGELRIDGVMLDAPADRHFVPISRVDGNQFFVTVPVQRSKVHVLNRVRSRELLSSSAS